MNLTSEIKNNNIMMFIVTKEGYNSDLNKIIKPLHDNVKKVCYVCFTKPYNVIEQINKKNKLSPDKFLYIDSLTKSVGQPPDAANCIFVSAPNALTEISMAFSKAVNEGGCDSALFDTLSALLVYENAHSIIQFSHNIINKLRVKTGKAAFIALKDDLNSELIKDLYMFVDKVIDLSK